jgi:hypothetical protein
LWCIQSGDDSQEDLARFGYKLNVKVIFFHHPLCSWLHTWTMYRNLVIFFNWSNYGYWKSQKALDFSTFNFYDNVIANEKKLVGSDVLHIEDGSIMFLRWVHFGAFRVSWLKIWMFTIVLKVHLNLSSIVFLQESLFLCL